MMKKLTILFLVMMFTASCNKETNKNTNENHPGNLDIE